MFEMRQKVFARERRRSANYRWGKHDCGRWEMFADKLESGVKVKFSDLLVIQKRLRALQELYAGAAALVLPVAVSRQS
jgi:hypothetical protein